MKNSSLALKTILLEWRVVLGLPREATLRTLADCMVLSAGLIVEAWRGEYDHVPADSQDREIWEASGFPCGRSDGRRRAVDSLV